MKLLTALLTVFAIQGLNACSGRHADAHAVALPPGPVRSVTHEPGVVAAGTVLAVRTNDTVSTSEASLGTIYEANVSEDVLDQNGRVLIPRDSPVELVVRSRSYLGPGGVGMTELILAISAVTVEGVSYPVVTELEKPGVGGLGLDRDAAKWIGGNSAGSEIRTRGQSISVPARAMLAFHVADPIRLRGFNR